ncbi:MAG: Maf family nucleotide pyrophosphatase [Promicromonosporaceae bacterium]|nr:Maf family nucleotide pyrophosphatase [Promicromonosporaceae bacterium]
MKLVLASKSPARLKTLRQAGVEPVVLVSDVDEAAVVEHAIAQHGPISPAEQALLLAKSKAESVRASDCLILGCDSVFELDGVPFGKPRTPEVAFERIKQMSGRTGFLHTGHWLKGVEGRAVGRIGTTSVTFGHLDDAEITSYVNSGEPLYVAGSFTVDGLGGPYVESIVGDYHNVVGLSLPLLRGMLAELGIPWHSLRE